MNGTIHHFNEVEEPDEDVLGGKGASLCEMASIGLPVPPGFVISTDVCRQYRETNELPDGTMASVMDAIEVLERERGEQFGGDEEPLLVSVRSGASVSMPGIMDTVLNIGLTDRNVQGLANRVDERFAYDTYRRLLQMYGSVILGIDNGRFEEELAAFKASVGADADDDLGVADLKRLVTEFKELIDANAEKGFPQDPYEQLRTAITAVFESAYSQRAIEYKNAEGIPPELGTAVTVVSMVFGNADETSGSGVMFTRNPSTGAKELYGEFLYNAQGEDIVSGARTPIDIAQLRETDPEVYRRLEEIARKLESHYREMQDIEFTLEQGELYVLQTRDGKRTSRAAVRIAVDMVEEGILDKQEAVERVDTDQLYELLRPRIDPDGDHTVIAEGIGASPGVGTGTVVFEPTTAKRRGKQRDVILVRPQTDPSQIGGIRASEGILTSEGGKSSHAAIVSREMEKPAVVGCDALDIDLETERFVAGDQTVEQGDRITIDGTSGTVVLGEASVIESQKSEALETILMWRNTVESESTGGGQ